MLGTLQVIPSCRVPTVSFNTLNTASVLDLNFRTNPSVFAVTTRGTLQPTDSIDHYQLEINGRSSLQLSLTGLSGNATLELVQDRNRNGTIDNGEILQSSTNQNAISELLTTDLNPGTYFIRVTALSGSTNYQLDLTGNSAPTADLIWRNVQTGQNAQWSMEGAFLMSSAPLMQIPDRNWQIVASADFNQDNQIDLVWRNSQTGHNTVWYMNGSNFVSSANLLQIADLNWQIAGSADFNRDNRPDLVWRNFQTGENVIWLMNGTTLTSQASLLQIPRNWQIVGIGDFNQNATPDLVWRNSQTGENSLWYLDGARLVSSTPLIQIPDRNWQITGVADMNGDRNPDLIWRNSLTGQNTFWQMNGANFVSSTDLMTIPDPNWRMVEAHTRLDQVPTIDGVGNTRSTAFNLGTLDSSATIRDRLGNLDPDDFYQFTLNDITDIAITASGFANGATMQLLDANGNAVQLPSTTGIPGSAIEGQLNPGTYFLRVFQTSTSSTAYSLSFSAAPRPVLDYTFVYYYNGQNTAADYYTGRLTTFAGIYTVGQFFDLSTNTNETGVNGRYFITGSQRGTTANLYQMTIQSYYDSETATFYTPVGVASRGGIGTEYGWLTNAFLSDQYFGVDFHEADLRSISAVQVQNSPRQGMTTPITWTDTIAENVKIDLFRNGVFHSTIAASTVSDGSHDWMPTFANAVGGDYRIRVTSVQDGNLQALSNVFSIASAGVIQVTAPNGGNLIRPDSAQTITWVDDISENVRIELYRNGVFQTTIVTSTESDGNFTWTVPTNLDGTDYQIRIASVSNSLVSDLSDAFFTIRALGDPGNTLSAAEANNVVFTRSQQVSWNDQDDFYRFSVGQSGIFTANLTGLTGDADVRLIQDVNGNGQIDSGEVIAWQWERGTASESIRRFISAGTYFLQVMSYNNQSAGYSVSTNFTAANSDDRRFDIQFDYSDSTTSILTSGMRNVLEEAAAFWERVISHSTFAGQHALTIAVRTRALDWTSQGGVGASARPINRLLDQNQTWMPTTGETTINSVPDAFNSLSSNLTLFKNLMIHEIGHVLGIGTLWDVDGRSLTRILSENRREYNASTYAGWAYGQLLGVRGQRAIPIVPGHWDETAFGSEAMTPEAGQDAMPVSAMTIAALRDLGWNVNYGAADSYNLLTQSIQISTSDTPSFKLACGCQSCLSNPLPMTGRTDLQTLIGVS